MSTITLQENLDKARIQRLKKPTPENMEAVKIAWQALNDATPKRKGNSSFASRAGQRQAKERRGA